MHAIRHILHCILLIAPLSFSLSTFAADPNNTTEQRDKNLERRPSGETMPMRDCLVRNGNDRTLCEQELANNPTSSTTSTVPRRQTTTNSQMRDDIKTTNPNPTDVQTPKSQVPNVPRIEPLPPSSRDIKPDATTPNSGTSSATGTSSGTTSSGTAGTSSGTAR